MHSRWIVAIFLGLLVTTSAAAQTSWQFRWQKGQALTYKVRHITNVAEVVDKSTTSSSSQLDLVKRWQVTDLDNQGTGTLELSLLAMRNEQKRASGDTVLFDSQNLAKSTPELRDQMSKFIGKTLAILRVDRYGRVVEAKMGSAARYEAEPPFALVVPEARPAAGQKWNRPYTLVIEPPQGTGEKYQAQQSYECKRIDAGKATLTVTTEFKPMPESPLDQLPLLQKDMQGEIVYDSVAGRLASVQLSIDRKIENHQGKGSSYHFKSQYSEVFVECITQAPG
jgi:hypothetical protein